MTQPKDREVPTSGLGQGTVPPRLARFWGVIFAVRVMPISHLLVVAALHADANPTTDSYTGYLIVLLALFVMLPAFLVNLVLAIIFRTRYPIILAGLAFFVAWVAPVLYFVK